VELFTGLKQNKFVKQSDVNNGTFHQKKYKSSLFFSLSLLTGLGCC